MGVNINPGDSTIIGLQLGTANSNEGSSTIVGSQIAALTNHNGSNSSLVGFRIAIWNGVSSDISQIPWLTHPGNASGKADGTTVYGLELGILGNSSKAVYGMQMGLINISEEIYGFQIGLVNYTKSLHGVQIGLANINKVGPIPFFPVLNVGF